MKEGRLSEGSGRCPENPQGTSPLTLCPGAPVFHGSLDNASAPGDAVVGAVGWTGSEYARIMQCYAGREDFRKDFRIKGFS